MEREDVLAYLGGCFYGEPASCSFACPFRLDLRSFLKKMSRGRFDAAYKELCALIPFPTVAAEFCAEHCAGACQCATVLGGEAIKVRELERAAIAYSKRKSPPSYAIPEKPQRIAVVGAGIAGLACALTLARKKYQVTVFEKESAWGGSLRSHPDFAAFDEDIRLQFSQEKLDFRFGEAVESLEQLADYDAVFIASGEGGCDFGLGESWNSELYYSSRPGYFLGGALMGLGTVEGMAAGMHCGRSIEAYIQTQNPENARDGWDSTHACRYVPHKDVLPSAAVVPGEGGYSTDEAKAEAGRCLQCDCKECMNVCELMQKYKKAPTRVASDVLLDGEARNSVSTAAITRETWSCNMCSRCAVKCQENTDVGGMLQLSRVRRVECGLYPPAIHSYWLSEMDFFRTDGSLLIPGEGAYAFFPGCRLGAVNPEYVLRSFDLLREEYGAGLMLNCCGIPAYWAGEQKKFEKHIEDLRGKWHEMGEPTMIMACPSCEKMFSRYLPEIKVKSLYEMLPEDKAVGLPGIGELSVFDPCAAAGHDGEKAAVRGLLKASGVQLTDFDSDGKCCGYGGHMVLANRELHSKIVENRVNENDKPYAVYCTNCRETFLDGGKESHHVLDVYFGLETGRVGLEEKRENAIRLKAGLMEKYGMGKFEIERGEWEALAVSHSEELGRKMDSILVPLRDVKKVIWDAVQSGGGFAYEDGSLLLHGRFDTITVWAKVREIGEKSYELLDVYSHRMRVERGGV